MDYETLSKYYTKTSQFNQKKKMMSKKTIFKMHDTFENASSAITIGIVVSNSRNSI